MTTNDRNAATSRRAGAWRPGSCTGAACAPSSPRRPRRCSSPRATSTPAPKRPRSASRARRGFIYSRYANPTVAMFEERMRLLEGAQAARATATGMAAVTASLLCYLRAGDHRRRRTRAVRLVPLRRGGPVPALRHRLDAGRRPRPRRMAARHAPQHQGGVLRDAGQPDARPRRHRRRVGDRARRGRAASWSTTCSRRPSCRSRWSSGADVVVYSTTKHIDGQGRCLGGIVLGSQA